MNYKKIIKDQRVRFALLKAMSFIPDGLMVRAQYYVKFGRKLHLKKPQRFTEWIQWYKVFWRDPVMCQCVDKADVRDFVKEKGLENTLSKVYGIWERAADVDFSLLPDKFVLKTTNGGGGENVIICHDKSKLDQLSARENLDKWLSQKSIDAGREWAYTGIKKPRIIAEELLEQPSSDNQPDLLDYKILCFGGEPRLAWVDTGRFHGHRRNIYDLDFNLLPVRYGFYGNSEAEVKKPKNWEKMIEVARKLSQGFPHVRVDMYNLDGKIVFGELTFYTSSGYDPITPDEYDFTMGEMFKQGVDKLKKGSRNA